MAHYCAWVFSKHALSPQRLKCAMHNKSGPYIQCWLHVCICMRVYAYFIIYYRLSHIIIRFKPCSMHQASFPLLLCPKSYHPSTLFLFFLTQIAHGNAEKKRDVHLVCWIWQFFQIKTGRKEINIQWPTVVRNTRFQERIGTLNSTAGENMIKYTKVVHLS